VEARRSPRHAWLFGKGSTAVSWAIVDALAEHAGKVTASNPMKTRAIASAQVKTDKC
jgi:hypothetical protein